MIFGISDRAIAILTSAHKNNIVRVTPSFNGHWNLEFTNISEKNLYLYVTGTEVV